MFSIKSNLNRRSNRYNIYQPQRYALYFLGKWLGLIGSSLILFSLTIKWYFLLDDNTKSVPNVLTWCLIIGSIVCFMIGVLFIVGLHWYVEKKYIKNTQDEEKEKTQKQLKEEHRNQSKRYKTKSSWLKWIKNKNNFRITSLDGDQVRVNNSMKQNSTTILDTNTIDSNLQIVSNNDSFSDTTSTATCTSFSSTKKLVRTNSKFNTPSLPIIDETKQQCTNNYEGGFAVEKADVQKVQKINTSQSLDIFDNTEKIHKIKYSHKKTLSSGSAKNYILEAFLKQDLTEGSNQLSSKLSESISSSINNQLNQLTNQTTSANKSINNQVINQLSNQSSISSQNNLKATNCTENNALDLIE